MAIYQVVVKASEGAGDQYRNVHHYQFFNTVPSTTALQELVDGIDAAYKTNLQANISDSVTFDAYDVRRVDLGDYPTIEYVATNGTWSGTNTNDPLPHQVAALVLFKALTPYPRSTRTYLFGFTEGGNASNGRIESGLVTNLEDWADDMFTIETEETFDPDKVAVQYGGDPRVVVDENDVTQRTVRAVWATQRRRRRGVGI